MHMLEAVAGRRTPVTVVEGLSDAELRREFIDQHRPVIVRGGARNWPAFKQWNLDSLKAKLGNIDIWAKTGEGRIHPNVDTGTIMPTRLPFFDYLDRIRHGGEEATRVFLSDVQLYDGTRWSPRWRALAEDVQTPSLISSSRVDNIGFWLSARGVVSWLHYDSNGCHNINGQLRGAKRVLLIDPSQQHRLYPSLLSESQPSNFSLVNVLAPDLARFPRLEGIEVFDGLVDEGDVLFIPSVWFHAFEHVGEINMNLNFWWDPETLVPSTTLTHCIVINAVRKALLPGPQQSGGLLAKLLSEPESMKFFRTIERALTGYPVD